MTYLLAVVAVLLLLGLGLAWPALWIVAVLVGGVLAVGAVLRGRRITGGR